jgi:hypothetical protein
LRGKDDCVLSNGRSTRSRNCDKELFPEDEGDFPLPASDVILMNGQVFLVSEFMEGEPLDKILEKVRTDPEYGREWIFNTEKFQKLAIFSLLIQPEDGRPQNYLVRKIKDIDEYQLILIDNERILEVGLLGHEGFIEHEDPDKGYVKTRMHCALLCFHELLEEKIAKDFLKGHNEKFNIDEEAIEKLINEYLERHVSDPDINEICDRGLIDLEEDHEITEEEYEAEEDEKSDVEDDPDFNWTFTCFSRNSAFIELEEELEESALEKTTLCVSESYLGWTQTRWKEARRVCHKIFSSGGSLAEFFWEVDPRLAGIYKIPNSSCRSITSETSTLKHILDRIYSIDSGRVSFDAPPSSYVPIRSFTAGVFSNSNVVEHYKKKMHNTCENCGGSF